MDAQTCLSLENVRERKMTDDKKEREMKGVEK